MHSSFRLASSTHQRSSGCTDRELGFLKGSGTEKIFDEEYRQRKKLAGTTRKKRSCIPSEASHGIFALHLLSLILTPNARIVSFLSLSPLHLLLFRLHSEEFSLRLPPYFVLCLLDRFCFLLRAFFPSLSLGQPFFFTRDPTRERG